MHQQTCKQTISLILLTSALAFASSAATAAPPGGQGSTTPGPDREIAPHTSGPAMQNSNGQFATDRDKGQERALDRTGKDGHPTDAPKGKAKSDKGHDKGTKAGTKTPAVPD